MRTLQDSARRHAEECGKLNPKMPLALLAPAGNVLADVKAMCEELGLVESYGIATSLHTKSLVGLRCAEADHEIDVLCKLMESEMNKQGYFAISPSLIKFYDNKRPLGDVVYEAFPSARFDLTEAGNCLACGNNVAAAFHMMRACEVGLWALGRDRNIALALSGQIEFAEWGKIIGELEKAVPAIQSWPNSQSKQRAHLFYNHALISIRAFNDGWRRHAAHVRPAPEMQDDEALGLWGHVSRFLTRIATKISEANTDPVPW
jgi:hypothetical protein